MNDQLLTTREAATHLNMSEMYLIYLRTKQAKSQNRHGPSYITIENYGGIVGKTRIRYRISDLENWRAAHQKQPKVTFSP